MNQRLTKIVVIIFTALSLPTLNSVTSHAAYSAEDNERCKDIIVIFASGSGQNWGKKYFDDNDKFATQGTLESEGEAIKFFSAVNSKLNSSRISVEYQSLHNFENRYNKYGYAAVPADAIQQAPQHRKDVNDRYHESVKDGAEELTWYLEDQMTSCPLQRYVLGGYSQGAQVVGDSVAKMQPQFRSRIVYMALYGDPKFNPNNGLYPVISGTWKRGNTTNFTQGILGTRKPYIPERLTNAGSWCNQGDTVCDAGYGKSEVLDNMSVSRFRGNIHSNKYQDTWIEKSAPEIAQAIKNAIPKAAGSVSTSVFINKNDKLWNLDLAVVIDTAHSMGPKLQSIKGNVASLTNSLLGSYWDTRAAVVTYDSGRPGYPMSYVESPFTHDRQSLRNTILDIPLRPNLGSGEYRVMYSGLMTAMRDLDWRYGAQKKIITITDKPPSEDAQSRDGWTGNDVRVAAYNLDPAVLNFANVSCDETWSCDDELTQTVESLATNSDGAVFNANTSFDTIDDITFFLEGSEMQPVAGISGDETGYRDTPLNLGGDRSYDPDGLIVTYKWDCDGDLVWDKETTQPNTSCTYTSAYNGLVTLQVIDQDGQSATATMPVQISGDPKPANPTYTQPSPHITYDTTGTTVRWNSLPSGGMLRFSDHEGNVLGYAPPSAYGVRFGTLGADMPFITVSYGDGMYWSPETTIALDSSKLATQSRNEPPFTVLFQKPSSVMPPASTAQFIKTPTGSLYSVLGITRTPTNNLSSEKQLSNSTKPQSSANNATTTNNKNIKKSFATAWYVSGMALVVLVFGCGLKLVAHRSKPIPQG